MSVYIIIIVGSKESSKTGVKGAITITCWRMVVGGACNVCMARVGLSEARGGHAPVRACGAVLRASFVGVAIISDHQSFRTRIE